MSRCCFWYVSRPSQQDYLMTARAARSCQRRTGRCCVQGRLDGSSDAVGRGYLQCTVSYGTGRSWQLHGMLGFKSCQWTLRVAPARLAGLLCTRGVVPDSQQSLSVRKAASGQRNLPVGKKSCQWAHVRIGVIIFFKLCYFHLPLSC